MPPKEKPKVEQNLALKEIEAKIMAKKMEFKQLQERERALKSELEKTQHNLIKTAGAYSALMDLRKSLQPKPKLPTPPKGKKKK